MQSEIASVTRSWSSTDISVDDFVLESEQVVGLWQPNWMPDADDGAEVVPRAMIALGWWKNVRFGVPGAGPYVGLRLGSSRDRQLRDALGRVVHERGQGAKAFPAGKPLGRSVWVRYRHFSAINDRYWEDLAPFRASLVGAVHSAYEAFASVIDEVLSSATDSQPEPLPTDVEAEPVDPGELDRQPGRP